MLVVIAGGDEVVVVAPTSGRATVDGGTDVGGMVVAAVVDVAVGEVVEVVGVDGGDELDVVVESWFVPLSQPARATVSAVIMMTNRITDRLCIAHI
jgi:hypothetical protein